MKSKLLKLANVKSEQEFYKKYPTEDAFLKAFPKMKSELKQFANGGPGDGDGDPKRKTKYPVLDVTKIKPNSTADSLITWAQLPIAQAAIANRMAKGEFNNLSTDQLKDSVNTMYKSFGVNPDLLYNSGKTMDSALSYYKNQNGDYIGFVPKDAYAPKSFVVEDHQDAQTRTRAAQSSKGKKVNADYAVFDINNITGDKGQVTLPGRDSNKIMVSLKNKNDDKTKPLMLTTRNDAAEQNTFKNPNYSGWNTVKNYYNDPSFNQEIDALSPTLENPNNKVTRTFTPNFIMKQRAYGGLQEYADGGKIMKDIGAGAYGIGEGILDTATFGLTDQLTDKGYTALQKAGGTTNEEELKQQNAIRGGGNIAGAAGTAIFTGGATTGAAIGQGAKGANEIVQNTNIVPDEYKQTVGSAINFAGTAGSMATGSLGSTSNMNNGLKAIQQMNQYKPFMKGVGFRNGGIQQYVDGGMGPNAEVEKQENTVAPDGTFTQYNGPSHEDGGIETTLDQGEMIFSDKLKPIGSKKTYAQLNKSFNTQKEDELLNDPKTNAVQKLTAAMMRRAKLTQSIALFQNQEQQKEAKVQAYADKMGVAISTPNSQAEEQMPDESQEMGEEMPMARMGGMIKRADGSYSKRGLWDNIRANKGSGKKPTKAMLEQEKKIKAKYPDGGAFPPGGIPKSADIPKVYYSASEIALDPLKRQNAINNMGIRNLAVNNIGSTMPYDFGTPQYVMTDQESPLILRKMRDALKAQQYANGGKMPTEILRSRLESHMSPQEADSYLEQYAAGGSFDNPGFKALPEAVQQKIMANYEMGGMLEDTEMDYTPMEGEEYMEYKKGGIYIKPENRGKFSAAAKRAGMGTQAYAKHILANKENYSSTLVKRANFARNAAKWHHEMGGLQQFATAGMYGELVLGATNPKTGLFYTPEEIKNYQKLKYIQDSDYLKLKPKAIAPYDPYKNYGADVYQFEKQMGVNQPFDQDAWAKNFVTNAEATNLQLPPPPPVNMGAQQYDWSLGQKQQAPSYNLNLPASTPEMKYMNPGFGGNVQNKQLPVNNAAKAAENNLSINSNWQKAAEQVGLGVLQNVGNIYNIARGLKKPEDWQYERATAQYLDPSADLAENARMYQEAKRASQYASAGNATNYLANTAAGRAAKMNADRLVRTNYGNANAQIANQLGLFNTQIANAEMNAKQQDEAQRRNLISSGLSNTGQNIASQMYYNQMPKREKMMLDLYKSYYPNSGYNPALSNIYSQYGTQQPVNVNKVKPKTGKTTGK